MVAPAFSIIRDCLSTLLLCTGNSLIHRKVTGETKHPLGTTEVVCKTPSQRVTPHGIRVNNRPHGQKNMKSCLSAVTHLQVAADLLNAQQHGRLARTKSTPHKILLLSAMYVTLPQQEIGGEAFPAFSGTNPPTTYNQYEPANTS